MNELKQKILIQAVRKVNLIVDL